MEKSLIIIYHHHEFWNIKQEICWYGHKLKNASLFKSSLEGIMISEMLHIYLPLTVGTEGSVEDQGTRS
jgi:hypothetical protein